jgi:cytidylate kinase
MRTRQRQWIAEHGGGVVEGRDIGSVVFPDATLKVYLVASPLVRAKRRVAQHGGDVEEIARAIAERDQRDSTREDSPLRQMPDAVVVDTSDHTVPEVIDEIRRLLLERGAVLRSSTSESDSETGDAADRLSS